MSDSSTNRSSLGLFTTLSVMMFVLFFTWGAWFAGLGRFMFEAGFSAKAIGDAYSCTPIAAIVTPFFIGVFADRFMNAERLQGLLMILGGLFIAAAPSFADPENPKGVHRLAACPLPVLHAHPRTLQHDLSQAPRGLRARLSPRVGFSPPSDGLSPASPSASSSISIPR